ncbi:MAG: hypothetical protein QME90_02385, partial [Thermodesulfobacteriota bacterium]|nr:hypothetical protein [Thermodesulfobacteriota bacterium]
HSRETCPRRYQSGNGNPDAVPAKAGNQKYMKLDSCFHRKPWIPAGVYPDENRGRKDNPKRRSI